MRYNSDREVNELQCREDGLRDVINSSTLLKFLGEDNYMNKVEEALLDILNSHWHVDDAVTEIAGHK